MLTLLTATGARPQAWAICERLMAAQDYAGPVRWVIVDDGEDAQPVTFQRAGWELEVVRPVPFWRPGRNTQARNLAAGLARIGADERVVVIEDDDHYAPGWLSAVNRWLESHDLVGEGMARYYNVPHRKARQLNNRGHASLCSTAVKGEAIAAFRRVVETRADFIDMVLWRSFRGSKAVHVGTHYVTGTKGLPGRGGIGMGHKANFTGTPDPDGQILRDWIGDDAGLYL